MSTLRLKHGTVAVEPYGNEWTKFVQYSTRQNNMETTQVNGQVYDVAKLRSLADTLPEETEPVEKFRSWLGPGHKYWLDKDGQMFGPDELLKNWPMAQNNPAWADHVVTIKRADLERPIWVMRETGFVFDGIHRLTRAMLGGQQLIKVKYFDTLPGAAVVKNE